MSETTNAVPAHTEQRVGDPPPIRQSSRGRETKGHARAYVKGRYSLISAASVVFVILLWQLVTQFGLIPSSLLPTLSQIVEAAYQTQVEGYRGTSLIASIGISMARVAVGFTAAAVVGIPIGLVMGRSFFFAAVLDPFVQFFRPLPPLGYYTLLILWFGIGDFAKVMLLFLAGVPIIIVGCAAATKSVKLRDVEAAMSLGLNQRQIFRRVVLPSALPEIVTSLRLALGTTFGSLVAAEIIAASSGLGFILYNAANYLLTDIVFMGIIVIGIIAVLLDRIALLIQRKLVPWQGKA